MIKSLICNVILTLVVLVILVVAGYFGLEWYQGNTDLFDSLNNVGTFIGSVDDFIKEANDAFDTLDDFQEKSIAIEDDVSAISIEFKTLKDDTLVPLSNELISFMDYAENTTEANLKKIDLALDISKKIQDDVSLIRDDVSLIQNDVLVIRNDVAEIQKDIRYIRNRLDQMVGRRLRS